MRLRHLTPAFVVVLVAVILALWLTVIDRGVWQTHHTVGVALLVPALLLWVAARYQLGDAFTTRAEARRLVTHGVYARIRHPIYVAAELLSAGLFIFIGHPMLLLIALVTIPLQVRRARREDRVLEDAFGDRYREYRRRSWF